MLLPDGTALMPDQAVSGSGMFPKTRRPARAASLVASETEGLSKSARARDATRIVSPFSAKYKGLIPSGLRASEHCVRSSVEEGKRVHAAQEVYDFSAIFLVEVEQDLGIGPAPQTVAALFEVSTKLPVVVDLTIERHDQRPVRPAAPRAQLHRLGPLLTQADDGKSPMGQSDLVVVGKSGPCAVGTACPHSFADGQHLVLIRAALAMPVAKHSYYTAHAEPSPGSPPLAVVLTLGAARERREQLQR